MTLPSVQKGKTDIILKYIWKIEKQYQRRSDLRLLLGEFYDETAQAEREESLRGDLFKSVLNEFTQTTNKKWVEEFIRLQKQLKAKDKKIQELEAEIKAGDYGVFEEIYHQGVSDGKED